MTVNVNSNGPATSLSMILVMEQLLLSSVVVAHEKEGFEATHLASGRTICKVLIVSHL
jgi:hypothetical protein